MSYLKLLAVVTFAALLAACTPPDQYPISGEECAPDDPVKELDAADCAVPAA